MDTINIIILTAVVNAIITGLVGGLIVYRIQKKIENSYAKQMKEFEAKLQYSNFEQQTKFSRTYPKKLEVLETCHQKFIEFSRACQQLHKKFAKVIIKAETITDEEIIEIKNNIVRKHKGFVNYFEDYRLHLPIEITNEIETIKNRADILGFVLMRIIEIANESLDQIAVSLTTLSKWADIPIALPENKKKDAGLKEFMVLQYIGNLHNEVNKLLQHLEELYKSVAESRDS